MARVGGAAAGHPHPPRPLWPWGREVHSGRSGGRLSPRDEDHLPVPRLLLARLQAVLPQSPKGDRGAAEQTGRVGCKAGQPGPTRETEGRLRSHPDANSVSARVGLHGGREVGTRKARPLGNRQLSREANGYVPPRDRLRLRGVPRREQSGATHPQPLL